jgi:hypothetical protein
MMEENQFQRKTSLYVDSSPAFRTSHRRVPTQTEGTLAAKHCMRHNPSNISLDVLTYIIVVEAQFQENEKKKFLIKEDQAVPFEKSQTIPMA